MCRRILKANDLFWVENIAGDESEDGRGGSSGGTDDLVDDFDEDPLEAQLRNFDTKDRNSDL
jgi:hypothetical protein